MLGDNPEIHWDAIKSEIQRTWNNITDEELELTRGNLSDLSFLILNKNPQAKVSLVCRLVDILHSNEDEHRGKYGA